MSRGAVATIDRDALRHNLDRARAQAPRARIAAAIKANAYGHGAVPVARALGAADAFAVACVDEALALRAADIAHPLVLLEGPLEAAEVEAIAGSGFEAVIHDEAQIGWLAAYHGKAPLDVWVKVDSGMHRIGFACERVESVRERLLAMQRVRIRGWMTHLGCADDITSQTTVKQVERFHAAVDRYPGWKSIANSAGVIAWPVSHADWVRPGIMLYGASPLLGRNAIDLGLRPVMTLTSRLIGVRELRCGDAVGYGATWTAPETMPVGVVAMGYGDGYPRHAPSGTPVLVNGRRTQLIGRVSMDMLVVDLRGVGAAKVGDPVTLWGDGLPADEIATAAGTIAYELFCDVTLRVPFRYIGAE